MKLTRRYRFSATHRLHSGELSEQDNTRLYGKCSHPFGHGHDYILEVTVRGAVGTATGLIVNRGDLDRLVEEQVLRHFHFKNLNTQLAAFARVVPTAENIALEIRRLLLRHWKETFPEGTPHLTTIRLYETGKNIVELREEEP